MTELLLGHGRVVDLALAVMAVELGAFAVLRRRSGWALGVTDVLGQLLAGALLLLALRQTLTGGDARSVLALLAASFPAHAYDLIRRVRRSSTVSRPSP